MPTEQRRIQVIVDEDVFRTLGLDPVNDGAPAFAAALRRYATAVEKAGKRLDKVLERGEWNAIADAMNGSILLEDMTPELSWLTHLRANVEDGIKLDGLDDKWEIDGPKLVRKIAKMTEIEGDAIAAAVRFFWADASGANTINHHRDAWWTASFRTEYGKGGS